MKSRRVVVYLNAQRRTAQFEPHGCVTNARTFDLIRPLDWQGMD